MSVQEFSSYVYKEDEEKTHARQVLHVRPFYLAILFILAAIVSLRLDVKSAGLIFGIGGLGLYFFFGIRQFFTGDMEVSVGHAVTRFKINHEGIFMGQQFIPISSISDLNVNINGYKGEPFSSLYSKSGKKNLISFKYQDKPTQFLFLLHSLKHKKELIEFCKNTGITCTGNTRVFYLID
jgi:hypothetical protein